LVITAHGHPATRETLFRSSLQVSIDCPQQRISVLMSPNRIFYSVLGSLWL
jgi:hypothetical protein